ncbi:MAG: universal stress protein [Deltaproteobacteria bacterium]|nr:universal stress protein [Deltaproteobacteria bacterium]
MHWVLGLDLGDRGRGALAFTQWLAQMLPASQRFVGVHVLEEGRLQQLLRYHHLDEVQRKADAAIATVISTAGAEPVLQERRVLCGGSPDKGLADVVAQTEVRGLILGRQAKRGQSRLVHLGSVARRLLRSLPCPVTVVPPDLTAEDIGDGPVLLAVNADIPAPGAIEFARGLARDLGRPLALAHVTLGESQLANELISSTAVSGGFFGGIRERQRQHLDAWIKARGLGELPCHIREGFVVDQLAAIARDVRAPMVVCGSRRLSLAQRLFSSSIATDLAAVAEVAVTVVPDPAQ